MAEPVSPVIPGSHASETLFGAAQPEYLPLPTIKRTDGWVLCRWRLTPEERAHVAETGSIYVVQGTFNNPLQPLGVFAAVPPDFAYALPAELEWQEEIPASTSGFNCKE